VSSHTHKKGTFIIPSGGKDHLFVILTSKCNEGHHLLVNFSSIYEGVFHDDSCVVNEGEHPFIKQPSYIVYRQARIDKATHLIKCFKPKEPVSDELFKRICEGLLLSTHTPKRVKLYFLENKGK